MNWLQTHSSKLVDVNDLVLLQHLIKIQTSTHWFELSKQDICNIINIKSPLRARNRRNRLIRDGVLERKVVDCYGRSVYRLVGYYA